MRPVRRMRKIHQKIPIDHAYYNDPPRYSCKGFIMNMLSVKITPQLVYLEIFLSILIWGITKSIVVMFQMPSYIPEVMLVLLILCMLTTNVSLWAYQRKRKEKKFKKLPIPDFDDDVIISAATRAIMNPWEMRRRADEPLHNFDNMAGPIEEEEEEDEDGKTLYPLDSKVGETIDVQIRVLDMSKDSIGGHHVVNPMKFGGVDFVKIEFILEAVDDDTSDMEMIENLIKYQRGSSLIGYHGNPCFSDEFGSNRVFALQDSKYSTEYDSIPHYARGCVTFKVEQIRRARHAVSIIKNFTLYRDEKTGGFSS